mgnify:CR=1 FL=1
MPLFAGFDAIITYSCIFLHPYLQHSPINDKNRYKRHHRDFRGGTTTPGEEREIFQRCVHFTMTFNPWIN